MHSHKGHIYDCHTYLMMLHCGLKLCHVWVELWPGLKMAAARTVMVSNVLQIMLFSSTEIGDH